MGLDPIIASLINARDASPYMRAINLFEFQVAITNSKSFEKMIAVGQLGSAKITILQTARIFAAIRFLEKIELQLRGARQDRALSIRECIEDQNYEVIFDNVIIRNGGWRRIRRARSAMSFDKKVKSSFEVAATVAKYIDFSYRYDKHPIDQKRIGGITAARAVVRSAPSFGVIQTERTKSKELWSEFRETAPFLYLLLIQNFPFKPPRVCSKTFCDELMKQAENVAGLQRLFRAYQHVCQVLHRHNYEYDVPQCQIDCDVPALKAEPFADDVIAPFKSEAAKSGA